MKLQSFTKQITLLLLSLFLAPLSIFAQSSIPEPEKQALEDFYNKLNGSNWKKNWDLTKDPTQWTGVKIKNGHVVEINLRGNRIEGAIPSSIANLTDLTKIVLSSNRITALPPELFKMKKLVELSIDLQNKSIEGQTEPVPTLTSPLPDEIDMPALQNLFLSNNAISGSLPKKINLPNCKIIALNSNQISGPIPQAWLQLSSLEAITLNKNKLSGEVDIDLSAMPNLFFFQISENEELTGTFPKGLDKCVKMQTLDLQYTNLGGELPKEPWANLPLFTNLLLSNANFSGTIPAEIASCTSMKLLSFGNNKFTGPLPDLSALKNLTLLEFTDNPIGGTFPEWITKLSKLTKLRMAKIGMTGTIPASIAPSEADAKNGLFNLRILDLSANKLTGKVPETFKNLSKLSHLLLGFNELEGNPMEILTQIPSLTQININDNKFEGELLGILDREKNPELSSINIENNLFSGDITDKVYTGAGIPFVGFYQESIRIAGNKFTFQNFQNLGNLLVDGFNTVLMYAPQKSYGEDSSVTIENEPVILDATLEEPENITGLDDGDLLKNKYQWYKNGQKMKGKTDSKLELNPQDDIESGTKYYCQVTNAIAPKLTLKSGIFTVKTLSSVENIADSTSQIHYENGVISYEGASQIAIYNLEGRLMGRTNSGSLDVSMLSVGAYVVSVWDNHQIQSVKIVLP